MATCKSKMEWTHVCGSGNRALPEGSQLRNCWNNLNFSVYPFDQWFYLCTSTIRETGYTRLISGEQTTCLGFIIIVSTYHAFPYSYHLLSSYIQLVHSPVHHQSASQLLIEPSHWTAVLFHPTWWIIPLSKWVISPVISGISSVDPHITRDITHLLSGMIHQVKPSRRTGNPWLPRPPRRRGQVSDFFKPGSHRNCSPVFRCFVANSHLQSSHQPYWRLKRIIDTYVYIYIYIYDDITYIYIYTCMLMSTFWFCEWGSIWSRHVKIEHANSEHSLASMSTGVPRLNGAMFAHVCSDLSGSTGT